MEVMKEEFCEAYTDGYYTTEYFDDLAKPHKMAIYMRNQVYEFPGKVRRMSRMMSCSDCLCYYCLYYWSERCPYGRVMTITEHRQIHTRIIIRKGICGQTVISRESKTLVQGRRLISDRRMPIFRTV